MIRDKREFEVELVVTRRILFRTLSGTEEEAIADAEMLFEDGDEGQILSTDIEMSEAYPVGDEPVEEDEFEEDGDQEYMNE
jgi:hypothetical protein